MNMSLFESLLKNSDPLISDTLNRALEEKEISVSEAARLFYAKGLTFTLSAWLQMSSEKDELEIL